MPGPKTVTIDLDQTDPSFGGTITFTVTQENYPAGVLWTAVKCFQDGALVAAAYKPVGQGYTFSAIPSGGDLVYADPPPDESQPMNCTAYVWEFPNTESPERNKGKDVTITFEVLP